MTAQDVSDRPDAGLSHNPFLALRATYGMLLGEDDFRVLTGNARGKQMLHTAWLHGAGVVWGYPITVEDGFWLCAGPGMAVDHVGRELRNEATLRTDARTLFEKQDQPAEALPGKTRTVQACLLIAFDTCLSDPVPTLADPCDVTRRHDDFSRVVERARLVLRPDACPAPPEPYPRVRGLLGLTRPDPDSAIGRDVARAAADVLDARSDDERAQRLLRWFRILAARDVTGMAPPRPKGDPCPGLFPAPLDDAAVPLAAVTMTVRDDPDGKITAVKVEKDPDVRPTLLPTATIQELACGWAPGVLGADTAADAGGPRVIPDSLRWDADLTQLTFEVTAPLHRRSLRDAVALSSLGPRGWVRQDLAGVDCRPDDDRVVVVDLAEARDYDLYRLVVRGTGPAPVFGTNPAVPLAGLVGGPPGTFDDGHDAVLTRPYPRREGRAGR